MNFIPVSTHQIRIIPLKTAVAEKKNSSQNYTGIRLTQVWQLVQWLSIDVAIGALCSSALACEIMGIWPLPWTSISILGTTVCLIYTADHLWDVAHMPVKAVTGRHLFHWQHKQKLQTMACILSGVTGIMAILYLNLPVILFGAILGSLVAIYIALINTLSPEKGRQWFHKEIYVAVFYSAGVWGIAFLQAQHITAIHWLLAFAFCLVVLQNLFLFSYYELEEDIQQQQRSIARAWGKAFTRKILITLFILSACLLLLLFFLSEDKSIWQLLFTLCVMSAILGLLLCFPSIFARHHRYRMLGDAVFFIPGLLLLKNILFI